MKNKDKKKIILMSIKSGYANLIFNEIVNFEYTNMVLDEEILNQKIYVYSSGRDKAIIGYMKVSDIIKVNRLQLIESSDYEILKKRYNMDDLFKNNDCCYALKLYDITEFEEYLELKYLRVFGSKLRLTDYCVYVYEDSSLYDVITKWDEAYSLDGNMDKGSSNIKALVRNKYNSVEAMRAKRRK